MSESNLKTRIENNSQPIELVTKDKIVTDILEKPDFISTMAPKDPSNKSELATKTFSNLQSNAKRLLEKATATVTKSSGIQQLLIGSASGWCTGFLATKVGKIAAFSTGGTIVLIAAASQTGLINVDWDKMNKKIENVSSKVETKLVQKAPNIQKSISKVGRTNTYFVAGFVGGFLLGIAS